MPQSDDQAAIAQLLPFYLNATLPAGERARVEAALASSAELRAELEQHRRLMDLVKSGAVSWTEEAGDVSPTPEAEVREIAASSAMQPQAPEPVAANLLAYLSPRNWNPAVSLALALAVMAQGAVMLWQGRTIGDLREENYQLASGQDPGPAEGAILVEFKDDAKWSDVLTVLEDEELTIVAGGAFGTLSLGSDRKGAALDQQIERLRRSPLVASADPAA